MRSGQADGAPERTFINTARRAQIVAAAIDTIAEDGYAHTSLARISARLGISKGIISYHFAGKDELIAEALAHIVEELWACMLPRITMETTGAGVLGAYIESNVAYMREHRNHVITLVELGQGTVTTDGSERFPFQAGNDRAVAILADILSRFQATGEFRPGFDPRAIAIAVRAAIDAVPLRLRRDPELDLDAYAREISAVFLLATRAGDDAAAPGSAAAG